MSAGTLMLITPEPSPAPEPQNLQCGDCNGEQAITASRMLGNQVVFRVKDIRVPTTKAPRLLSNEERPAEPAYHTRRPHRKSRTGCANCKKRRVKCDETRPICRKCQIYGISCDYSAVQLQQPSRSTGLSLVRETSVDVIESYLFSLSLSDLASRLDRALRLAGPSDEWARAPRTYVHSKTLESFHHFITIVSENLSGSKASAEVMRGDMVQVAFNVRTEALSASVFRPLFRPYCIDPHALSQSPYLMHALLGAATTHLRQTSPHGDKHRLVEGYHWHNAIKLYQKELATPIGPHNMDPLMSTCLMLGILALGAENYRPADSWVFSSDPAALNWLIMQCGLKGILVHTFQYLEQSIWFKVFMESDDEHHTYDNHAPGREGLHSELADLCEIDETTTENENPYHWPLRMLSPLLKLESSKENWGKFTPFIGRLLPEFTNLLLQKDPKALVVLSYWLGKMCLIKGRWFNSRFLPECMAICMYLENSDDSRILKLLEYPAACCGYLLRHVREEAVFEANLDLIGLF